MSVPQPLDLTLARCPSWTIPLRCLVVALASAPFAALMIEIHRPLGMWLRIPAAGLPAVAILILLMAWDLIGGNRMPLRGVLIGAAAGGIGLLACDLFRWPLTTGGDGLPLFDTLPRIGQLLWEGSTFQSDISPRAAWTVGWAFHLLSAITFGIMYVALVGQPTWRNWPLAPILALGAEGGLLLSRYPVYFHIDPSPGFIFVDLLAHLIYGAVLGIVGAWISHRVIPIQPAAAAHGA